jgi:hypothetical protein
MTILILLHEESDLYKQIQMVYIWTVYEWVSNCLKPIIHNILVTILEICDPFQEAPFASWKWLNFFQSVNYWQGSLWAFTIFMRQKVLPERDHKSQEL